MATQSQVSTKIAGRLGREKKRVKTLSAKPAGKHLSDFLSATLQLLVSNPTEPIADYVQASLAKHAAGSAPRGDFAHLRHKVRRDPFATVPYDVLDHCVSFLPNESLLALCQASLPVYSAFDGHFWKQRMLLSMPWFFEAIPLLEDAAFMSNMDPRRMFVCLERMSKPQRGLRGLRMNIANRRRVWGICAQLAARYNEKLPRSHNQGRERLAKEEEEEEDEAQSIMANATIPHMPRIREDPRHSVFKGNVMRKPVNTVHRQWIRAWEEIGAPGTAVETAWNKNDRLTGVAVEIRGELRRFGSGWDGNVCRRELPAGVWIDGLILHIQQEYTKNGDNMDYVAGVEVRFET